ncbi:IS630 family transposase [Nonomuraea sp. NPDC004297]
MADSRLEPVVLSEEERRMLTGWARRRSTAQGLAMRARIVLACAEGGGNVAVAARLRLDRKTVARWRSRFLAHRLAGLSDEPRPGVPRTITDTQVEVVVRALEEVPAGSTHWSKRELARKVGISASSVLQIWRAVGLKPWRTEDFKISTDPLLIDKIRDVVGLYLALPDHAAVFAVDEKPQIQALQRNAPVLPMLPGVPERRSFDYVRHGTVDLFAALNTATGQVIGKLSARHHANVEEQHELDPYLGRLERGDVLITSRRATAGQHHQDVVSIKRIPAAARRRTLVDLSSWFALTELPTAPLWLGLHSGQSRRSRLLEHLTCGNVRVLSPYPQAPGLASSVLRHHFCHGLHG